MCTFYTSYFINLSLPRADFTKPRKLPKTVLSNESQGVSTQMKALDEYVLMVVLKLLLSRVHFFASFMFEQRNVSVQFTGNCQ